MHFHLLALYVLHRVDVRPAMRRPGDLRHIRSLGHVHLAGEHGGIHPPVAGALAEHGDDGQPLALLREAAELIHQHPQRAVADVGDVARENLIGQARRGRRAEMLGAHVVAVRRPRLGRVRELHTLTVSQFLHDARCQRHQAAAILGVLQREAGQGVRGPVAKAAGDERDEQVRQFLPLQHRVVVVADHAQPGQRGGQRRHAAQLARPLHLVNVRHLRGRDAQQLALVDDAAGAVTGVLAVDPVRHALAALVQLDAAAHPVAYRQPRVLIEVEQRHVVRLDDLQLQRHRHAVGFVADSPTHKNLAGAKPRAHHQGLLRVEIQHAVRVGVRHPLVPQLLQLVPAGAGLEPAQAGRDAPPDQVGDPALACGLASPIVALGVARAGAQEFNPRHCQVWAALGRVPPAHAPAGAGRVIARLRAAAGDGAGEFREGGEFHASKPRPDW